MLYKAVTHTPCRSAKRKSCHFLLPSFLQGDPVSLNLYDLQQEPFLRGLSPTLHGITITNFRQLDEDYCDNTEFVSEDVLDLVGFNKVMTNFESTSGVILSRNEKSKGMGLGPWQGREDWPDEVNWLKTKQQLKLPNLPTDGRDDM